MQIPKGITTIGDQAFGLCHKLWYVRLPDTLVELQGFNECESLIKIEIPSSVKVIKEGAFRGSNIKELIIPEGLEEIESNAFAGCWLADVNLPDSVKIIGDNAFMGSCIHHINIPPHAILGKKTKGNSIFD